MEKNNDFSEKDFLVSDSDGNLPVPNQPFEGESFDVTEEMNSTESNDRYYEVFEKSKTKSMVWSVCSLVFGIASVALSMLGWVALILGVLAVAFSVISRFKLGYFDGKAIWGLILGIFGIVFGIVMIVWNVIFSEGLFSSAFDNAKGSGSSGLSDI